MIFLKNKHEIIQITGEKKRKYFSSHITFILTDKGKK